MRSSQRCSHMQRQRGSSTHALLITNTEGLSAHLIRPSEYNLQLMCILKSTVPTVHTRAPLYTFVSQPVRAVHKLRVEYELFCVCVRPRLRKSTLVGSLIDASKHRSPCRARPAHPWFPRYPSSGRGQQCPVRAATICTCPD